ncbi:pigment epithelium-derived factor [Paramormyrops kingsleyae]|uniref:pigment epithelium-derived factor n=1 Tax=Paramormyrops kingsleyae TaxID=1676925 RepID=UPI003B972B0F
MMQRTAFLFLLCVTALFSSSLAQQTAAEEEEVEDETPVELFTTPTSKLAAATSDFGYNLFRQMAGSDPKASVLLSPISVSAALTQLSMGASPDSERQLYRVLRYHNLWDPQLHNTLRDLLASLRTPDRGFSSAARVCMERRLRVRLDYLNAVEKQYGVRPKVLLGSVRDVKDINDWVKQQTGSKVDRFLTSPFPRGAGLVPLSAGYFKGRWVTRFTQSGNLEDFNVEGASPVKVAMMKEDRYPIKMGADPDLGCTIAQVQMDGDVSMIFFLPDEVTTNTSLIEEALTAEFVQDLVMTLHPVRVDVTLPMLKLSYSADLLTSLSNMGLSDWLTQTNLQKISNQAIKVSTVRHKVAMETAPEGSQYPSFQPSTSSQALAISFRVNRPFIFLVRDEKSGTLLLIGKVLNPRNL